MQIELDISAQVKRSICCLDLKLSPPSSSISQPKQYQHALSVTPFGLEFGDRRESDGTAVEYYTKL